MLGLFMAGPYLGIWIIKGTLASSTVLDTVDLSDPFILLQSFAAGHMVAGTAIFGALLITGFYLAVGGRSFCAWVCPINPITDSASWLRRKLGINTNARISRNIRYWLLPTVLLVSFITGQIAFEAINPITMLHRGILFGIGAGWMIIAMVFLFDLLVVHHGWCGHICPVGAFYGLIGKASILRVSAEQRNDCTKCGDCFQVCPEPHIISPALFPVRETDTKFVSSMDCINCGRCMDICDEDVFTFTLKK